MHPVTIYHNPNCSKSRKVLELIRDAGIEPTVIEYLNTPLTHAALQAMVTALNVPLRTILRESDDAYSVLNLGDPKWRDDELLDFMIRYPSIINRPIVMTPLGARLCRPETVLHEILP
ncbi:MAG: arsenate reductase (glutaredoxin) [Sterolibacterium sp.]|nr:arsenate reductase (glutaredoxin) [Sterolibacterium sp.]MBP9800834.1 arsenate reductase (glutaredoxin) [Sterolibacterium sp.]